MERERSLLRSMARAFVESHALTPFDLKLVGHAEIRAIVRKRVLELARQTDDHKLREIATVAIVDEILETLKEIGEAEQACNDADLYGSAESAGTAGTFNNPNADMQFDKDIDDYLAEDAARMAEEAGDDADPNAPSNWNWGP